MSLALPAFAQDDKPQKPGSGLKPPGVGVIATAPDPKATNIVLNSSLDEANATGDGPKHWQEVDNLVFFWTADPAAPERGKVIKIDTDVQQKQAYDWWVAHYIKKAPLKDAPPAIPGVGPKWDTIGAYDGGFYWSDLFEIKPGRAYKVILDVKGPGAKVFLRGYVKKEDVFFADEAKSVQEVFREARGEPMKDDQGRPIRYFNRYKYSTWFTAGGDEHHWKTYTHEMPRHPTGRDFTSDVRYLRVMLYPYWPATTYWFDNIRVYEVDPDPSKNIRPHDDADHQEGKVVK